MFKPDLNVDNVLGSKGEIVYAYLKTLSQLWVKENKSFSPNMMKRAAGNMNPMFEGYQQHDSQEFLNFLLDTLHEDLNRVKNKPYVENIEASDKDPEEAAFERWTAHLRRNQSIIVDLMHGQYKSTLKCPNCNKISITYDPFLSLPLPIPNYS